MADKGKGVWALRNAKPQRIDTGGDWELITDKSGNDRQFRLQMDRNGGFIISSAGLNNERFHRMGDPHCRRTTNLCAIYGY